MSREKNGVILTSNGDLLRSGFCDFENDGSFDSGTETYKTNVPLNSIVLGTEDQTQHSRWNGSNWILVDN